MVNPTLNAEQLKAINAVGAWVKERQRRGCAVELIVSALAGGAGLLALCVTFGLFCCLCLVFAPLMMIRESPWLPLLLTALVSTVMFIDGLHSRRDDFSIVTLWLLRETFGLGPRLLLESARGLMRANRLATLEVRTCAEVLAYIAVRRKSVSREELARAFPGISWARIQTQLRLFPGVLFLRPDTPRVTLTDPLRFSLRRILGPQGRYQPEPETEPQAEPEAKRKKAAEPPRVEPETLSAHEILGVSPLATWAEIKAAYRNRVKECHPDRFPGLDAASREMAEDWTKSLNAAYATLAASKGRSR